MGGEGGGDALAEMFVEQFSMSQLNFLMFLLARNDAGAVPEMLLFPRRS